MTQLRAILTSGLISLLLVLIILGMVLGVNDSQPVQAGSVDQPIVTASDDNVYYLPLTDAPPRRDITQQQFAPLASPR
jgi:hypothetical protein